MTTITFKESVKVLELNLPKGISLLEQEDSVRLVISALFYSERGHWLNMPTVLSCLIKDLQDVVRFWHDLNGNNSWFTLNKGITMKKEEYSTHDTYIFYKNVEKSLNIKDLNHGISILKDIFHK